MNSHTLEDLFVHELSDMHSAEKQLIKALPKLARAVSDPQLASLFQNHLVETEAHLERLEKIFEMCGQNVKRKKCESMAVLIEESEKTIRSMPAAGRLRDIGLAIFAQKVETHEISSYLSIMRLAHKLGLQKVIPLLSQTLDDEENADQSLASLSNRNLQTHIREGRFQYHQHGHQEQTSSRYA